MTTRSRTRFERKINYTTGNDDVAPPTSRFPTSSAAGPPSSCEQEAMNPECRTLIVCRSQLVDGFVAIGPDVVAAHLQEKKLISNGVHRDIAQQSMSANDKARSLIAAIIDNVKVNPGVQLRKFKAILSRNRRTDLVQLLEDKFGGKYFLFNFLKFMVIIMDS